MAIQLRQRFTVLVLAACTAACGSSPSGGNSTGAAGSSTSAVGSSTAGTASTGSSGGTGTGGATTSGGTSGGGSAGTTAGGGSGGQCGIGAGTSCNQLSNSGPIVDQTDQAADAPGAQGGALVDGTYFLTSDVVYTGAGGQTGPTGNTAQVVAQFSAGTLQLLQSQSGCPPNGVTASTTTSPGATTITLAQSCPTCSVAANNCQLNGTLPYTLAVTGTTTTFTIDTGGHGKPDELLTFTLQH